MRLYRGMKEEGDRRPRLGPTARTLGVRPGTDVLATGSADPVAPGGGGLSVAPDDPLLLPRHRRPASLGGTGLDPVWSLAIDELGDDLSYRPDPDDPAHGFIEPARAMNLDEFQGAISGTRDRWTRASP